MNEPTRYDCAQDDRGYGLGPARMEAVPHGDYVRYDDYAALQQQNAALVKALERLIHEHGMSYPMRRDALIAARAALALGQAESKEAK